MCSQNDPGDGEGLFDDESPGARMPNSNQGPPKVRPEIVQKLLIVGRSPDPLEADALQALNELKKEDEINRLAPQDWHQVSEQLTTDDVIFLAKGLTRAETKHRWIGGSVAAVIWVFQVVKRRAADQTDSLAEWIVRRNRNQWVPFGSMRERDVFTFGLAKEALEKENAELEAEIIGHGGLLKWLKLKRSWLQGELKKLKDLEESERKDRMHRELEQSLRAEIEYLKAQNKELAHGYRSDARTSFLQEAESLNAAEKLKLIVENVQFDLNMFPEEWAKVDIRILNSLDEELRTGLLRRLANRRKGAWRQLFKRLQG